MIPVNQKLASNNRQSYVNTSSSSDAKTLGSQNQVNHSNKNKNKNKNINKNDNNNNNSVVATYGNNNNKKCISNTRIFSQQTFNNFRTLNSSSTNAISPSNCKA